ncbi:MAG: hypothetical protein KatS3mg029_1045 [Saprospiraceae bacterium]|nr:MAG: hypothetical protein KatS3mg029_1045 [Saprospiraceae bacterium]
MRMNILYVAMMMLVVACQAQEQKSVRPPEWEERKALAWNLRDILRMQLPLTLTDTLAARPVGKSYSFDLEEDNGLTWVIPEKYHDPETMKIFGGGRYLLPFDAIDPQRIRIERVGNPPLLCLLIEAKEGQTFTWHPYTQQPEEAVSFVRLGWYDAVQERTLTRALAVFKKLAGAE